MIIIPDSMSDKEKTQKKNAKKKSAIFQVKLSASNPLNYRFESLVQEDESSETGVETERLKKTLRTIERLGCLPPLSASTQFLSQVSYLRAAVRAGIDVAFVSRLKFEKTKFVI
jgi:hypothetical protein